MGREVLSDIRVVVGLELFEKLEHFWIGLIREEDLELDEQISVGFSSPSLDPFSSQAELLS